MSRPHDDLMQRLRAAPRALPSGCPCRPASPRGGPPPAASASRPRCPSLRADHTLPGSGSHRLGRDPPEPGGAARPGAPLGEVIRTKGSGPHQPAHK